MSPTSYRTALPCDIYYALYATLSARFNAIAGVAMAPFPMPSHLELRFQRLFSKLYPEIELIHDQVKPVPKRKFRLDFAHPDTKVGIEISGSIWRKGGHSSGVGLMRDYEKMNLAQANGWIVFQLASKQITAPWCDLIVKVIQERLDMDN